MKKVNYRRCYSIPTFERSVIGHIVAGDCEQLEYDLETAKDSLEQSEKAMQRQMTEDERRAVENTINALKGIIRRIGTLETVGCDMCGDTVLKSACTEYDHKHICKSCESAIERQYYTMDDDNPELPYMTAYLKENNIIPTAEENIESELVREYEYAIRDNADKETMAWIYQKMKVELRRTFNNGKGILYAILLDDEQITE